MFSKRSNKANKVPSAPPCIYEHLFWGYSLPPVSSWKEEEIWNGLIIKAPGHVSWICWGYLISSNWGLQLTYCEIPTFGLRSPSPLAVLERQEHCLRGQGNIVNKMSHSGSKAKRKLCSRSKSTPRKCFKRKLYCFPLETSVLLTAWLVSWFLNFKFYSINIRVSCPQLSVVVLASEMCTAQHSIDRVTKLYPFNLVSSGLDLLHWWHSGPSLGHLGQGYTSQFYPGVPFSISIWSLSPLLSYWSFSSTDVYITRQLVWSYCGVCSFIHNAVNAPRLGALLLSLTLLPHLDWDTKERQHKRMKWRHCQPFVGIACSS